MRYFKLKSYGAWPFLLLTFTLGSCGVPSPHDNMLGSRPRSPWEGSQPFPGSTYPGSTYPGSTYPGSTYPGATYSGSPHPGSLYPGGPYPGNPYPIGLPRIDRFDANPPSVIRGQPMLISWSVWGAQTVTIDYLNGGYNNSYGSVTIYPQVSTTYTLRASGRLGEQVAQQLKIWVDEPPARLVYFSANPTQVRPGDFIYLTWNVENCAQVAVEVMGDSTGGGIYGCQGTITAHPRSSTSYTLRTTGLDGQMGPSPTVSVYLVNDP